MYRTIKAGYLSVLALILLLITSAGAVSATSAIGVSSGQEVIDKWVAAVNSKDWAALVNTETEENKKAVLNFLQNTDPNVQKSGIKGVKSLNISEIMPLPNELVSRLTTFEYYLEKYTDLQSYLVGFDFKVDNESKYIFNGVNYRLIIVGVENGEMKIVENSVAPLSTLTEQGYSFGSADEIAALEIETERLKGRIVNKEKTLLETNIASTEEILKEHGIEKVETDQEEETIKEKKEKDRTNRDAETDNQGQSVTTSKALSKNNKEVLILNVSPYKPANQHYPPSKIRVYRSSGVIQEPILYDYVRGVLPNEWIIYTTPKTESLKAGAIAVKMVAFYRVWYPKYPDYAYDVKDTVVDQVYNPESGKENSSTLAAINAVGGIGVEASNGSLFYLAYRAGTAGDPGVQGGGILRQQGADYWNDQGKYWMWILHYYYDNATVEQSPGTNINAGVLKPFFYDGTTYWNNGESLPVSATGYVTGQKEKWFKVSGYTGSVDIETFVNGSESNTYIELYDNDFRLLRSDDNSGGGYYSRIAASSLNGQPYYIKVRSQPSGNTVNAAIQVTTARTLTTSVLGYANGGSNYSYTVFGDGRYASFETLPYSSGSDTYLELYNSSNVLIASNDDHGEGTYSLISKYFLNSGQTYYVRVRNYSNGSPVFCQVTITR